jgi:hypothetical protein
MLPTCFTDEGLDYFKDLIEKFDNNSWESARDFKDFILGNKGVLVRTNVATGPNAGCSIHCHCVTYTKEHMCEDCLCIQLMKKEIQMPANMLTLKKTVWLPKDDRVKLLLGSKKGRITLTVLSKNTPPLVDPIEKMIREAILMRKPMI